MVFLEFYDRFGALQPLLQPEVLPPRTRKFRRQRVWFGGFGAALGGAQRFEGACGTLTPPVGDVPLDVEKREAGVAD